MSERVIFRQRSLLLYGALLVVDARFIKRAIRRCRNVLADCKAVPVLREVVTADPLGATTNVLIFLDHQSIAVPISLRSRFAIECWPVRRHMFFSIDNE